MSAALDAWFLREILPHESALTRYLRRGWIDQTEVPDFRQEIYVRIYESAAKQLPRAPKAFLFATARNLIADRMRRERVVSIDYTQDIEQLNVLPDNLSPEYRINARQELRRLASAFDQLSDQCRDVLWLRRIEGLSQRETAERLGMPEGTVESHLCRGLRFLVKAILCTESANARDEERDSNHESKHGQRRD